MRVTVKGRNVQVTDSLKAYAEKKLQKLTKYFHNIKDAQVTQSIQRNWHIVEVLIEGDGIYLRGEERSGDMYASIDAVVEKLEKQLERFKGKLLAHPRPLDAVATVEEGTEASAGEISDEDLEEGLPTVVKTKRFSIKPMSAEEAAMQMELVNHDFFVFLNDETEQVNVLYRRKDGNYGLIEPEF
jgi:putative sigma-54 modulation protein